MRVLLVEDDIPLRDAIHNAAADWSVTIRINGQASQVRPSEILVAATVAEGLAHLERRCDLVIVDVRLGEESGLDVVRRALALEPGTTILAISGTATATEAFQLAALGVRGYLGKPFDLHELRRAIQGALEAPPDLQPGVRAQVGYRPILAVQEEVRLAMLKRALQLAGGNITHAAEYLGIGRSAVQQMIDHFRLPRARGA